jgi:cell wall-associated NlpC family hydrolase
MTTLDRRLHAFRPDLADARLKGQVEARAFSEGNVFRIVDPVIDIRRHPAPDSGVESQALYGETVRVYDDIEGFGWGQLETDSYVGHVPMNALKSGTLSTTHVVSAPRTFLYPGADMKFPVTKALSMGSRLMVAGETETRGTKYFKLESGEYLIAGHATPINEHASDPVWVAARLLETPYLWGGRSAFGIDCSALVQLTHAMCGIYLPRDSDMLANGAGRQIGEGADHEPLKRGDLVFWKGHVAMLEDDTSIIHASGHAMQVVREPLNKAIERIGYLYGLPTMWRRIAP